MNPPPACPDCGTQIAPSLLACPACGRLVHSERLKELARRAEEVAEGGELTAALTAWRDVLELLPADSRQAVAVAERVEELRRRLEADPGADGEGKTAAGRHRAWLKGGGALAAAGLLAWKLKAVVAFVVTKGKVLLLGLTKSGTLLSMLASAGLYWAIWGWRFACGLVVAIYVHEMGHVVALRRLGIRATAPMFIPGLGAFVRLKQYPANPAEDARVGLAGPIWGLGAVLVFAAGFLLTGWDSLGAIARFAAWINLFNLLPIWQLDGGRGFRALDVGDRWVTIAVIGGMWWVTGEGLLVLLLVVGVVRTLAGGAPEASDRLTRWQFVGLVVAFAALTRIPIPGAATGIGVP